MLLKYFLTSNLYPCTHNRTEEMVNKFSDIMYACIAFRISRYILSRSLFSHPLSSLIFIVYVCVAEEVVKPDDKPAVKNEGVSSEEKKEAAAST